MVASEEEDRIHLDPEVSNFNTGPITGNRKFNFTLTSGLLLVNDTNAFHEVDDIFVFWTIYPLIGFTFQTQK